MDSARALCERVQLRVLLSCGERGLAVNKVARSCRQREYFGLVQNTIHARRTTGPRWDRTRPLLGWEWDRQAPFLECFQRWVPWVSAGCV